jgi:hypothetical protein
MIERDTPTGPEPVRPAKLHAVEKGVVKLPDGGLLRMWETPMSPLEQHLGFPGDDAPDPFADAPRARHLYQPALPDATVPPRLANWIASPGIDLRPLLKEKGIPLADEDIAVCDLNSRRVLVRCRKRESIDLLEQLFESFDLDAPKIIRCETWLAERKEFADDEIARAFLTCWSGQLAELKFLRGKTKALLLNVEPVLASSDGLVDLRWAFDVAMPGKGPEPDHWSHSSSATLPADQDQVLDAGIAPDGRHLRQGLRVDILMPKPIR